MRDKLILLNNFLNKAKNIHNDKYDYSLVDYKNNDTKVKIICPTHGIFEQIPHHHTAGKGCKKCADDLKKLDIEIFINRSKKSHNNKYDYSLVDYKGAFNKVKIICPIHGVFSQKPCDHITGYRGCPKCGGTMKSNTNEFILKAQKIHGNKYDYSLVDYKLCTIKVKIICSKHGIFDQKPTSHLSGKGCPVCNQSKGEKTIKNYLKDNNYNYIYQKTFDNCKNKKYLPFDFYLPDYNICIEYDGIQHYEPNIRFGGEDGFKKIKINDKIKTDFCNNNNIKLIRINYKENIIEKIKNYLNIYGNSIIQKNESKGYIILLLSEFCK